MISYTAIPTSSLAASQLTLAVVCVTPAARKLPGAPGGCRSLIALDAGVIPTISAEKSEALPAPSLAFTR
jgi:hypothetical protein